MLLAFQKYITLSQVIIFYWNWKINTINNKIFLQIVRAGSVGLQKKLVENKRVLAMHRAYSWYSPAGFALVAEVLSGLHTQPLHSRWSNQSAGHCKWISRLKSNFSPPSLLHAMLKKIIILFLWGSTQVFNVKILNCWFN